MALPTPEPTHAPSSELSHMLHQVGEALGDTLRATLDGNREAARQVLRAGARRRRAVRTAQEVTAGAFAAGGAAPRRAAAAMLLVSDVDQVSRLVDHLARHVAVGGDASTLSDDEREAVLLLARFGEQRLRQLAHGPVGPDLDRDYVRCGQCLFGVLARLDAHVPCTDATTGCCAAMTASILQASRHATIAA